MSRYTQRIHAFDQECTRLRRLNMCCHREQQELARLRQLQFEEHLVYIGSLMTGTGVRWLDRPQTW